MKKHIQISILLLILALSVSACSKSQEELLIGNWECNANDEGMNISAEMEYVRNGKSTAMMEITGQESGVAIAIDALGQGSWTLSDGELVETIDKLNFISFTVGGEELPTDAIPPELRDSIVGASTGSEIVQLDERVLITKNAGATYTCTRV
ncbi:hypothetical protein [Salinisphaera sp.]|uniref:hypothetical protein n=1 Tax=Salinisphaera sp. TaxID=1914330 RepID=UPI000C64FC51|nr:hypothetical protein [Salinisphaera sp.]MAS08534.1 hypothetical protein [Salinisphaera sp.]|tara:strand:+ start:113 stop:568 length:456 start_codon:yes stop_codon:yes gene_type:complete